MAGLKRSVTIDPSIRGRGRRPAEKRAVLNGILWWLSCGAPWRDVPEKDGKWNTICRRFRRWSEAGIWEIVSVTLTEMMADIPVNAVFPELTGYDDAAAIGRTIAELGLWQFDEQHAMLTWQVGDACVRGTSSFDERTVT